MDVRLGKIQKKIIHQAALKNGISPKEAELLYVIFFKGVREEFEKFNSEDPETDVHIRLKHLGKFVNQYKVYKNGRKTYTRKHPKNP